MENFLIRFIKDIIKKTASIIRSVLVYSLTFFLIFLLVSALSSSFIKGDINPYYFKEKYIGGDKGSLNKIVFINLNGEIASSSENTVLSSGSFISPTQIENIFLQIKTDSNIKAIIFDINSPGGSAVASDRIYEQIVNFRRESNIPTIALFSDIAASGAYYIASACDYIVANPSSLTGSIGTIMESYNLEKLYEKIGIEKFTFTKGEYKDMLNENREPTEKELAIIDSLNENTYQMFISRVAEGRKLELDYVKSLATGQIYSGKEAYDLKLIDSLGNRDEAIYQAKSLSQIDRAQIIEYQSENILGDFLGLSLKSSFANLISLPQKILLSQF